MIEAICRCSAGLDVHKATVTCTILREDEAGKIKKSSQEYSSFKRELRRLAEWLKASEVELAVMESTGIYWKTVYEVLEAYGIRVFVVNARYVKNVPGRKTDVQDSEWLAELARCGLLRASFIPPRDFRQLRLLSRYRLKLAGYLSGEKNRLHKVLEDCGIRLGCVVSDINGVSAQRMIEALIEGRLGPAEMAKLAVRRLRKKEAQLELALEGNMSDRHRFLLRQIISHINWLERQIAEIDSQVGKAMEPYKQEWELLQTIPGVDETSAAMLLTEVGVDMSQFGSPGKLSSWAGMCPGNNESAGKKRADAPARVTGT